MARRNKILASAVALSGILLLAQKEAYGQDASETTPPSGTERRQETGQPASLTPGTPINVALEQTLDSKKLVAGASVIAKTTEEVKQDGKVVLPKGSKVLGHVTVSSARSKGDSDSTLALEFDRAELKGGQQMALQASIQAVAAAPAAAESPIGIQGPQGTGGPGPTGNSGINNRGTAPGASSGAASTVPRTNQGVATDPYWDTGTTVAGSSGTLKPNSRGVFGLSGLSLDESTANSGQGTMIHSAGKTVHLDGGTRLLLVTQGATTAER
jgi:hypothetical protein